MGKDTFYFSHDYNVRNDEKIKRLIRRHGFLGYGLFWAIVEDLYNNANALRSDYEGIAFELRSDPDTIKSIINDFDLFVFDGDTFGSLSVDRRLDERSKKSISARESAKKRWDNANAMRSQFKRNAIKERKGKEIKGKDINNIKDFIEFRKLEFDKYPEAFKNRLKEFGISEPLVYTTNQVNDQYKDFVEIIHDSVNDEQWQMQISRGTAPEKVRIELTKFIDYCLKSQSFRTSMYINKNDFQRHFVNKQKLIK